MTSTSHTKQRRLLVSCTGAFITHIPYRGSAPALQDVMAGQVDFVFDSGIAFPHIKAGKVKLLGVASDQKSPFFPDAPTYADLGIKNASLDIWFGVWAPTTRAAASPRAAVARNRQALAAPSLKERFNGLGAIPAPLETAAFRKLLADEAKTLSTLIKERGITAKWRAQRGSAAPAFAPTSFWSCVPDRDQARGLLPSGTRSPSA